MAIRGSLGEATLADVLQLLALGRKTGCLSVFEGQSFGRIYLHAGRVSFATIINRKDRLGDILLRNGVIDRNTLQAAVDRQDRQRSQRLGQLLVEAGAISRAELEKFISIQIEEAVYFLFTWPSGSFHFEPGITPDDTDVLLSLNPERLLLEGARRVDEWAVIRRKVPSMDIVFGVAHEGMVAPAELTAEQRTTLSFVDGVRTVRELIDLSGLLDFEGCRALFGLVQAGLVTPVGKRPSSAGSNAVERVEEHENLAIAFYQTGMLAEAERESLHALELEPSRSEARFRLAAIDMRRGRLRDASRRLMELIGDGRLTPSVFLNLALSLEGTGRLPHALVTVEEGIRSFPGDPPLLLSRAVLLTKTCRPAAAVRAFEEFATAQNRAAIAPADYFVFSGLALAATGAMDEASDRVEEGLRYYPHVHALLLHGAVIHERMNRLERAFELFERALREEPRSPQVRRGLADTLYRAGKLDEAAELYHDLLSDDDSAELNFRLGSIAYDRGNRVEAVNYWRAALRREPGHLQARTRLRLVEAGLPQPAPR